MTTSSEKDKNIIVIAGPTGSGKTDLAVALAEHFDIPVISADSRQFYRGMAIGTAQPDAGQLSRATHYFIASHEPQDEFTAGRYEREALELLERIFETKDLAIVVGGTGLYINALCRGMDDIPDIEPGIREQLNRELSKQGLEKLSQELAVADPEYHRQVDLQNPQRVIRALEVCRQTGKPFSSFRSGGRKERSFGIIKIGTILPRQNLYERIERRVDAMIETGLEKEARGLYPLRRLNALQTVGYKEMFMYFDGEITFETAVELIKRNSRRYAKRQLTWFSRDEEITWFSPYAADDVIRHVNEKLIRHKP